MIPEDHPTLDQGVDSPTEAWTQETAGTMVGRYRLIQKIGEGGMGEVWLAEQKEPVRRRVALKLVKAGINSRETITRFESERQALALMDHPAIAKVLDAGSTEQGAPYFVMEYVAGVPITTYCDSHRLSTHARLDLFLRVCEGVQHAHQKAIIHRDLKPSNLLVAEVDGKPVPKIIDFGVAKALTQKLTADTMFTRVGAMIGTPEYMSPEQALSSGEDIDTRTDVYSLGIVLYELLAGTPPLELRKIAFDEFLRKLREDDAPKPSTRIRIADRATSTALAHKRQSEPVALARQLRGDLDSIVLKALEKDRSRRYASPSDLASDIGRYLRNETVLAVPPSLAYRSRKFVRRYRLGLATACAFVLVLIAATVVSVRQSIRANREAAAAQAVNDFLRQDLLAQASAEMQSGPNSRPDLNLTVRTALDRAASRIAGKFDSQPEVEASIRQTIADTYDDLGLYSEARKHCERALELRRTTLGPEDPETLVLLNKLAWLAHREDRELEAEALYRKALEISRRALGPEHPTTLSAVNGLAVVCYQLGKYAEAEQLDLQNLEVRRRINGPEHPQTLTSLNNVGSDYIEQGKYREAEIILTKLREIMPRIQGAEHPMTLRAIFNLARIYDQVGKDEQAETLHREVLESRRRVLGPEHPDTLSSMNSLANVQDDLGKFAEAEALYREIIAMDQKLFGRENTQALWPMNNLGVILTHEGKFAEAETVSREALELRRRLMGPESADALVSLSNVADIYRAQGRFAEAETVYLQVLEIRRRVMGPKRPLTLLMSASLADIYHSTGKHVIEEKFATEALAGRRDTLGRDHPDTIISAADLAMAYQCGGKFIESEPLAREALESSKKTMPENWQRFRSQALLGVALAGQKKFPEAEPLLLEGYQGMLARKDRIPISDRHHLTRARQWLVQFYQAWGKPAKAATIS